MGFFAHVLILVIVAFYLTFVGFAVVFYQKYSYLNFNPTIKSAWMLKVIEKESFRRFFAWSMIIAGLSIYLALALAINLIIPLLVLDLTAFGLIFLLAMAYFFGLFWFRNPNR